MELEVKVPFKRSEEKINVLLYIEILENKNNRHYSLRLKNSYGIDSLNY